MSSPGHNEGLRETPRRDHELEFWKLLTWSVLDRKLVGLVTEPMCFPVQSLTRPVDFIPLFLIYSFAVSSAHNRKREQGGIVKFIAPERLA